MCNRKISLYLAAIISLIAFFAAGAPAQTTAFNFQGRLNDGTSPANGKYDLQFKLYDAITGGNQVGSTVSKPSLTLINGVFSTQLDFGLTAFSGSDRFIEISLRQAVTGTTTPNAFVILGPRQQILSVPYTIRSSRTTLADDATHAANADNADNAVNAAMAQNAVNLGNLPSGRYVKQDENGNVSISRNLQVYVGTVSIGTGVNSTSKLEVDSTDAIRIKGVKPFLSIQDITIGDDNIGNHQIKSENGGLSFILNQNPTATTNKTPSLVINKNGSLSQPQGLGLPKAIVKVTTTYNTQTIYACYDAVNNHVGGTQFQGRETYLENCGITISRDTNIDAVRLKFPFDVRETFPMLTFQSPGNYNSFPLAFPGDGNSVDQNFVYRVQPSENFTLILF